MQNIKDSLRKNSGVKYGDTYSIHLCLRVQRSGKQYQANNNRVHDNGDTLHLAETELRLKFILGKNWSVTPC